LIIVALAPELCLLHHFRFRLWNFQTPMLPHAKYGFNDLGAFSDVRDSRKSSVAKRERQKRWWNNNARVRAQDIPRDYVIEEIG